MLWVLDKIISYVIPYRCISCAEFTYDNHGICASCWNKLDFVTKPYCKSCGFHFDISIFENMLCAKCISTPYKYDLARTLLKFDQHSKKLIHNFKYHDHTHYAKLFAKLLVSRYNQEFDDVNIIAPVPMNRFKRILRNYNQSQILAKELAKLMQKTMIPDLLIKSKWTKPQTRLSKKQRITNLQGSIKFNHKYDLQNKIVLLVDDVYTTGTTSNICSKILKQHAAKSVKLATIAMT